MLFRSDHRAYLCRTCKDSPIEKLCSGCHTVYPIEQYGLRNKRGKQVRMSRCRSCEIEYANNYRKNNLEKVRAFKRKYNQENPERKKRWHYRSNWVKKGYNADEVEKFISKQEQRCSICGVIPEKRLCLDHCHKTGKIRGLLCENCNRGIGMFQDDVAALKQAIAYLEKHQIICENDSLCPTNQSENMPKRGRPIKNFVNKTLLANCESTEYQ